MSTVTNATKKTLLLQDGFKKIKVFLLIMRYSRQEIFIGSRKQKLLRKATVTIVGCGGTGSVAAEYLARAGVNLHLIDRDIIEMSDLQRQLYREEDMGKPKALALKERLEDVNSEIRIAAYPDDLNASNIEHYLSGSSLVLDGSDNMQTRFLLNDFCMKNKLPFTYAAAIKSEALFTLIMPCETPCLRCFIPNSDETDTCETAGVLGPAVGAIGIISAAEAIKYLTTSGLNIKGHILHMNFYKNIYELIELKKSKNCPSCRGEYEFLDKPSRRIMQLCGGTYQFLFGKDISVSDIVNNLGKNPDFKIINKSRDFVQLSYKKHMISLFKTRMIVQNAKNEKDVRVLTAKIIGI